MRTSTANTECNLPGRLLVSVTNKDPPNTTENQTTTKGNGNGGISMNETRQTAGTCRGMLGAVGFPLPAAFFLSRPGSARTVTPLSPLLSSSKRTLSLSLSALIPWEVQVKRVSQLAYYYPPSPVSPTLSVSERIWLVLL